MTDGHIVYDHAAVNGKAHLVDRGRGAAVHLIIIKGVQTFAEHLRKHICFLGFSVEKDILGRGKAGDQRELLMHHADTGGKRVKGRVEGDLLAVNENVSAVSACFSDDVHTEEYLHQRALTGAVLTAEAEHLAGHEREVDIRQNLVAEEVLLDILHLQQWSIGIYHIFQILT